MKIRNEYTIAGLHIAIPAELTEGAFQRALAPFRTNVTVSSETGSAASLDKSFAALFENDDKKAFEKDDTTFRRDTNECSSDNGAISSEINSGKLSKKDCTSSFEKNGVAKATAGGGTAAGNFSNESDGNSASAATQQQCEVKETQQRSTEKAQQSANGNEHCDLILSRAQHLAAKSDYRELDDFDFPDADADCRFGRDAAGYLLTMTPRSGRACAHFRKAYGDPFAVCDITSEHHQALFRFGLWTLFNLAALEHEAVAIHSSVIEVNGQAVLFLGESGTGKSTHTRLWREHIAGARLLNDDSPILRLQRTTNPANTTGQSTSPTVCPSINGTTTTPRQADTEPFVRVEVCGSPWSGKVPCFRNEVRSVAGIVRLSQAPKNEIRRLSRIESFGALLPSCPPLFAHDEQLQDAVCGLLSEVVARIPVYHLACLPNAAAAQLAYDTVFGSQER